MRSLKDLLIPRALRTSYRTDADLLKFNDQMEKNLNRVRPAARAMGSPITDHHHALVQSFYTDRQFMTSSITDSVAFRRATLERAKGLLDLTKEMHARLQDIMAADMAALVNAEGSVIVVGACADLTTIEIVANDIEEWIPYLESLCPATPHAG
ncbi:hypothetical protein K461DRAFT_267910 [Myriangium duriaei CBS 260.36]|uniref:Uncharacterized protein n=1 Tax=Myriangium duriaei CBS 260.36 TaxID=1168546 RepID=A0A9P4MG88_9PEZI|nr:hypothetical protein K461DRAFT_267910 [Myriangium duriaei CBS 260.36]